jgi:hypothetical protein
MERQASLYVANLEIWAKNQHEAEEFAEALSRAAYHTLQPNGSGNAAFDVYEYAIDTPKLDNDWS